jgi:large subunit ribosomal protein L33
MACHAEAIALRARPSKPARIGYNESFNHNCQSSKIGASGDLMAKGKKKSETVFLVCKESGDYNYTLKRKSGGEKLNLKKYCGSCRKHTEHNEKKK